jgi:hypothetical protein
MTADGFLKNLQTHAESFAKAVATNEGEWIIKGFPPELNLQTPSMREVC